MKGKAVRRPWEIGLFWVLVAAIALTTMLVLSGSVRVYAGDVNGSTLFVLSSFLGSLAAVLGIAFTLTLIGVQLAAQSYTHRVMGLTPSRSSSCSLSVCSWLPWSSWVC